MQAAGQRHQIVQIRDVEVADPPVPDQAGVPQVAEGLEGLGQRHRPAPVQQVQIDPARVQPPQAALAGLHRALPGRVVRPHLGDQEDLFAAAGDSLADEYLRIPVRIHLGGVDQVHADVQTTAQRGNLRTAASPTLAEAPGALAEHRDLVSGRQRDGPHGTGHESSASSTTGRTSDERLPARGRRQRHRPGHRRPARRSSASSGRVVLERLGGRVWSDTGPAAYLDVDAVVTAATSAGCEMLHPGYGFGSERPQLAARCAEAGVRFAGPARHARAVRRQGGGAFLMQSAPERAGYTAPTGTA